MSTVEVELQEWWRTSCPLFEYIGLVVEAASDERYRCQIPLSRGNSNHLHSMHAGVQMAVVEALGGIVGMTLIPASERLKVYGAVRSFSIEFLRAARSDLVAETFFSAERADELRQKVKMGESTEFTLESTVRDTSGETVARAVAVYIVRPARTVASN